MQVAVRRAIASGVLVAALAGCGGGPGETAGPGQTAGPGATSAPGAGAPSTPGSGPGETPRPASGPVVAACDLLPDADIQAVTGYAVASREPYFAFGILPNGCRLVLDGNTVVPPEIVFGVLTPGGRAYWDRHFAPYPDEFGREELAGVGDAAYADAADSIVAVRGDALMSLQFLDDRSRPDATADLGRAVLRNLGD